MLRFNILFTVLVAVGMMACGGEKKNDAQSAESQPMAEEPMEEEGPKPDGKVIFKTYCVACHGEDGKLGLNGAKDYTQSTLNLEERIAIITNGKNLMTPYKDVLKEEEIKAVAEYTMKLSKGER